MSATNLGPLPEGENEADYRPFYVGSRCSEAPAELVMPDVVAGAVDRGECARCHAEIWVRLAALADFAEAGGGELVLYCSTCAAAVQGWNRRKMPRHMRRSRARSN